MEPLIVVVYVTLGLTGVVLPLIGATLLLGHADQTMDDQDAPSCDEPPATA